MLNLKEVVEQVKNNIKNRDIKTTGLQGEETEIIETLYLNKLINHQNKHYILIYGGNSKGTNKVSQAKLEKETVYSMNEFKEKILFNHPQGAFFKDQTILIDSELPNEIFAVLLTNPQKIIRSSQLNKRNSHDINVIISNKTQIDKIKPGLESMINGKPFKHYFFDVETSTLNQYTPKHKHKTTLL